MKPTFQIQSFRPSKMNAPEKDQLTDRLYTLHQQIFSGVSKAEFRKYVVEPDSRHTHIRLYTDREGNDAGYLSFQVFETGPGRRDPLVVRTEVGFLPNYRRYNITLPTLVRSALKFQLATFMRKGYFLATPVHPTPYRIGLAQLPEVWPHPEKETPAKIQRTIELLKSTMELERAENSGELSCKVGWQVKESQILKDRIQSSKDPATRFYLSQNPNYSDGNGMLMVVPLTFKTYYSGLLGLIKKRVNRRVSWRKVSISIPVPRIPQRA
jgi:hypothetical protein